MAGRLRDLRPLGEGGMGATFVAEREVLPGVYQRVVVKRPKPGEAIARRWLDEARALAAVDHPNVVKLLDAREEPAPELVLEYVDGVDAHALIAGAREGEPLSPEQVAWIAHGVARALGAAHAVRGPDGAPAPVLHRDVSPRNVLLSREGEVKLTDFGIAWAPARAAHTATGELVGNARYMAPEQLEGRVAGPATDVYGVGALLEALLAAGAPCAPLAQIAARATQRAPAARYADMDALLAALEDAVPALVRGRAPLGARVRAAADARAQLGAAFAAMLGDEGADDGAQSAQSAGAPLPVASAAAAATTTTTTTTRTRAPSDEPVAAAVASAGVRRRGAALLAAGALVGAASSIAVAAAWAPWRVTSPPGSLSVPREATLRAGGPARATRDEPAPIPAPAATQQTAARASEPLAPAPPRALVPVGASPRVAARASSDAGAEPPPATLRVNALPRAEVRVDDGEAFATPHAFRLAPGAHILVARFVDGRTLSQPVRLAPGEDRALGLQPRGE